jgi:hypothetical protein
MKNNISIQRGFWLAVAVIVFGILVIGVYAAFQKSPDEKEVKIGFIIFSHHLKTSLRAVIGQLLEYAYYPDKVRAKKLYLVSNIKPDPSFIRYIEHLRGLFNIPFGYLQFDVKKRKVIFEL